MSAKKKQPKKPGKQKKVLGRGVKKLLRQQRRQHARAIKQIARDDVLTYIKKLKAGYHRYQVALVLVGHVVAVLLALLVVCHVG